MMNFKSILLIDDNIDFCNALAEHFFLYDELKLTSIQKINIELELLKSKEFDLILLEINLLDLKIVNLSKINNYWKGVPLIIFSTGELDYQIEKNLTEIPFVFLRKPFRLGELSDVIKKLSNKDNRTIIPSQLELQSYTFNPLDRYLINNDNEKIRLTESENKILEFLYKNRKRVVNREELLTQILGYNEQASSHALETHIYRLRKKIEKIAGNLTFIESVTGGYKLKS